MSKLPTGTVTFIFTDIEGSTSKWERFPLLMKKALVRHDEILKRTINLYNGYTFKTVGDAFCAAFETAIDAVRAALSIQLETKAEKWTVPDPIKVRIGIHTGEAVERDGDYYGQPVNRTARLESTCYGGQTVMSLVTTELIRDGLPEEVSLKDLGDHRLKDLTRFERVFQVCHPALEQHFPPLKSLDTHPNNLPIQPTALIGRTDEIELLRNQVIDTTNRVITLVGVGGIGKTRLSLQIAADLIEIFDDGVFFCGSVFPNRLGEHRARNRPGTKSKICQRYRCFRKSSPVPAKKGDANNS